MASARRLAKPWAAAASAAVDGRLELRLIGVEQVGADRRGGGRLGGCSPVAEPADCQGRVGAGPGEAGGGPEVADEEPGGGRLRVDLAMARVSPGRRRRGRRPDATRRKRECRSVVRGNGRSRRRRWPADSRRLRRLVHTAKAALVRSGGTRPLDGLSGSGLIARDEPSLWLRTARSARLGRERAKIRRLGGGVCAPCPSRAESAVRRHRAAFNASPTRE